MKFTSLDLDMPKASPILDLSLSLTNTFFPKLKPDGLGLSATSSKGILIHRLRLFEDWCLLSWVTSGLGSLWCHWQTLLVPLEAMPLASQMPHFLGFTLGNPVFVSEEHMCLESPPQPLMPIFHVIIYLFTIAVTCSFMPTKPTQISPWWSVIIWLIWFFSKSPNWTSKICSLWMH